MSVPMKYLIFLSILIASSLSSSFAFANPCEDTRQLKSLWETKYIKLVQNPEALGNGFDRSSMAFKLANAICILEYPGLPKYDGIYYRYYTAMIKTLIINLDSSRVTSGTLASTSSLGVIEIHREFFNYERPDMPFAGTSTILHEARHVELALNNKPNYHVKCTKGILKESNIKACDAEFAARWEIASPRSYEVMFLSKLYEESVYYTTNQAIKASINNTLENYINDVPIEIYQYFYKR